MVNTLFEQGKVTAKYPSSNYGATVLYPDCVGSTMFQQSRRGISSGKVLSRELFEWSDIGSMTEGVTSSRCAYGGTVLIREILAVKGEAHPKDSDEAVTLLKKGEARASISGSADERE